jgi:hypothetical protein
MLPTPIKVQAVRRIREVLKLGLKEAIAFYDYGPGSWETRLSGAAEAETPEAREALIRAALIEYYEALNARQHGGVAQNRAFSKIETILNMSWGEYRRNTKP